MFIVVFLIALVGLWIWSLVNMPSKRAYEIFDAAGPAPSGISDRDRAWVMDLHRRFGTGDFTLKSIRERRLDGDVARRFGMKPTRLDDFEELGVRLPHLELLVSFEPGRYRLTETAAQMADSLKTTHASLETEHHG